MREKLVVKVSMDNGLLSLRDDEGVLDELRLSKLAPGKRKVVLGVVHPEFIGKHKIITIQYPAYMGDLTDKSREDTQEEIPFVSEEVIPYFNPDRESRMAYDLDHYNIQNFIKDNCAQTRLGVQKGVRENYWLLNLIVEDPAEIHLSNTL